MLRIFLEELKNNQSAKRSLCLTDTIIDEYIREYDEALIPLKTFITVEPDSVVPTPTGVVISRYTDNNVVNRPTSIRKVGNEWWVSSYYDTIARFDENFSYLGRLGYYGNPNTDLTNYAYTYGFYADTTDDILVVACYAYHRVIAYRISDWTPLWSVGDGTAGNVSAGRLYNPYDVDRLPNGNFIIASYNGRGQDAGGNNAIGNGHVTEIDATTGAIIASRIMYNHDGYPWHGDIANPSRVRVYNDRVYVASYTRHVVGVWDVNTWEHITTYTKPKGIDVGALYIRGIVIDDVANEIVASLNGVKCIAGMGLDDHDLKWASGEVGWDDRSAAINTPGVVLDIFDLCKYDDNNYLVCDYGNNRVTLLPKNDTIQVHYTFTLESGYEVVEELLPSNFDLETGIRTYNLKNYVPGEKLCVPIRKCCVGI